VTGVQTCALPISRKVTRKAQPEPPHEIEPYPVTPSAVAAFKKHKEGELVRLPSGLSAQVTRPGIQTFLKAGVLPDALRGVIEPAIRRGQGMRPQDEKELAQKASQDPKFLEELVRCYDVIVHQTWQAPRVLLHEREVADGWEIIPEHERDPMQLYTDEIDFDDKAFTFNFAVGGVRDLKRFRQQFAEHVDAVSPGADLEVSAQ